ncbi:cytochrome P450-like protein [Bimuria novae-zelandiae CBS 107.79]|uniref:Cytochrome P450-like protein n=1 Tax=Bimuria novae-zelandiae CBS 107.79 TaxID=1447943 RepID=A0A6A5VG52_9PLEO|nr:cytochrome P450-like protein [Bimuria novae-zelandiae CBS 107.79]
MESYRNTIVRYGPHRIAVNTNAALRDIYHVRANCQKSQFFTVFSHFFKTQMVMTTLDHKEHAFKRRIAAEALTSQALKQMEAGVLRNIRLFCDKMIDDPCDKTKKWNSARNMSQWCGWLVNDIMGDITFHQNWNMLTSDENRDVLEVLNQGVGGLNMMGHMPGILKLQLDKIFFRGATEGTYKYQRLTANQCNFRIEQGDKIQERDIFGSLMAAHDSETNRSLTRDELIAEAGLFVIAGSDTTGSAITATIFYLLHNEECYGRLQKEILGRFSQLEDIHAGEPLNQCQYLHACITEAMRLSPGVGGILLREVMKPGMTVDGTYFPPGTDIGVANYAIHHNEAYFPEPFLFRPTRWLHASEHQGGVTTREIQLAQSAYAPFSVGRANCVGKNLAYNEMITIVARLIFLYDMRIQPGSALGEGCPQLGHDRSKKNEFQTWDRFVSYHEGPMVEFRPR